MLCTRDAFLFALSLCCKGLKDSLRASTQADWMSGKTSVIVATISFGMGIDKADVRSVEVARCDV